MNPRLTAAALAGLLFLAPFVLINVPLFNDITLPALFSDHMVLQQGARLPVWGWASPGEVITVSVGGESATTTTDADGKWRVDLPPLPPGTPPQTLTVAGHYTTTIHDVLVGDVWICSGQSNMEFGIQMVPVKLEDNPGIRIFTAPKFATLQPLDKIFPLPPERDYLGKWQVATADMVARDGTWGGFSAIGYLFAREIHRLENRPIGMIEACWGGSTGQEWLSLAAMEQNPALAPRADYFLQRAPRQKNNFPIDTPAYSVVMDRWNKNGGADYMKNIYKPWQAVAQKAHNAHRPAPPPPPPPLHPRPADLTDMNLLPTVIYNGEVHPLIPYAIKGVLWYQGESGPGNHVTFYDVFPAMIEDWRRQWGQGDFPFLFVQLPNYGGHQYDPWAFSREAQANALALPNTGMAVTIDVGEKDLIHPPDKIDIAARLVLAARHVAYGEDLVFSGPTFDTMTIEHRKLRLHFQNVGGGLIMGVPPWTPDGKPAPVPTKLLGFEVAGKDMKWFPADAVIDGATVVVSSKSVRAPVIARYAWAGSPVCNLYNKEGLPAVPFRTNQK